LWNSASTPFTLLPRSLFPSVPSAEKTLSVCLLPGLLCLHFLRLPGRDLVKNLIPPFPTSLPHVLPRSPFVGFRCKGDAWIFLPPTGLRCGLLFFIVVLDRKTLTKDQPAVPRILPPVWLILASGCCVFSEVKSPLAPPSPKTWPDKIGVTSSPLPHFRLRCTEFHVIQAVPLPDHALSFLQFQRGGCMSPKRYDVPSLQLPSALCLRCRLTFLPSPC